MEPSTPSPADPAEDRKRFEVELEFVQCLASPEYLHFLAQNNYLNDPAFLRYLSYLDYWTSPAYAKFVVFPHALYFLQMLRQPSFREALRSPQYALILHQQQGYQWQFASSPAFRSRSADEHDPPVHPVTDEQDSGPQSPTEIDRSSSPDQDMSMDTRRPALPT